MSGSAQLNEHVNALLCYLGDEALLFRLDGSRSRALHPAHGLRQPASPPPNAPDRESIELRCLSFF